MMEIEVYMKILIVWYSKTFENCKLGNGKWKGKDEQKWKEPFEEKE